MPLAQEDEGIAVNLNAVVHSVYADGSYDLDIDYGQDPPEPPLSDDDRALGGATAAPAGATQGRRLKVQSPKAPSRLRV